MFEGPKPISWRRSANAARGPLLLRHCALFLSFLIFFFVSSSPRLAAREKERGRMWRRVWLINAPLPCVALSLVLSAADARKIKRALALPSAEGTVCRGRAWSFYYSRLSRRCAALKLLKEQKRKKRRSRIIQSLGKLKRQCAKERINLPALSSPRRFRVLKLPLNCAADEERRRLAAPRRGVLRLAMYDYARASIEAPIHFGADERTTERPND